MKLNKSQRFTAYCIMLAEAQTNLNFIIDSNYGFCCLSRHLFALYPVTYSAESDQGMWTELYPELFRKRPKHDRPRWFGINRDGWRKRVNLLKQCIIETHP